MKVKIAIVNVETGEQEIIERDLTEQEKLNREISEKEQISVLAETEARAQAKAELLQRLGITEDEAKLLLA